MVRAQRETPLAENEVNVFPTATFILAACLLVGTCLPPPLPFFLGIFMTGHVATFRLPPTTSCEYDVTGDGDILACH